jgi:hypothetical protein
MQESLSEPTIEVKVDDLTGPWSAVKFECHVNVRLLQRRRFEISSSRALLTACKTRQALYLPGSPRKRS